MPGVSMTSSWTSATWKMPSSSMSMSGQVSDQVSRQSGLSFGWSAMTASSRAATSIAAPTWSGRPWVQMTASTSRSPTCSRIFSASLAGSMTMASSSSPMIQVLFSTLCSVPSMSTRPSVTTRSIRAVTPPNSSPSAPLSESRCVSVEAVESVLEPRGEGAEGDVEVVVAQVDQAQLGQDEQTAGLGGPGDGPQPVAQRLAGVDGPVGGAVHAPQRRGMTHHLDLGVRRPGVEPLAGVGPVQPRVRGPEPHARLLGDDDDVGGPLRERRARQRDQARPYALALVAHLPEPRHQPP